MRYHSGSALPTENLSGSSMATRTHIRAGCGRSSLTVEARSTSRRRRSPTQAMQRGRGSPGSLPEVSRTPMRCSESGSSTPTMTTRGGIVGCPPPPTIDERATGHTRLGSTCCQYRTVPRSLHTSGQSVVIRSGSGTVTAGCSQTKSHCERSGCSKERSATSAKPTRWSSYQRLSRLRGVRLRVAHPA